MTGAEAEDDAVGKHLVHVVTGRTRRLVLGVDDRVGGLAAIGVASLIDQVGEQLERVRPVEMVPGVLPAGTAAMPAKRLAEGSGDEVLEDLPCLEDQPVGPDLAAIVDL